MFFFQAVALQRLFHKKEQIWIGDCQDLASDVDLQESPVRFVVGTTRHQCFLSKNKQNLWLCCLSSMAWTLENSSNSSQVTRDL